MSTPDAMGAAPAANVISAGTILLVDDEPESLRVGVAMLRARGFDVLVAMNGVDGLRIARHAAPDLVLLDVRMPGLDGISVCKRLRADPVTTAIPVLFLSALGDADDRVRGFEAGAVDYVTKPFDARELLLRVLTHLRLARGSPAPAATAEPPAHPAPEAAPLSRDMRLLLCARDRLLADLARPITLEQLAWACGSNRTTLQALFRRHLGMTVGAYLREQRLHRARALLADPGVSVAGAARAVGYRNARDLARAYRARFGAAPSASRGAPREPPQPQPQ
jgi:DNA-binding response OmpR family regulator